MGCWGPSRLFCIVLSLTYTHMLDVDAHTLCLTVTCTHTHTYLDLSLTPTNQQDLVLSEVETLATLGAGGFGRVTLVRYKGE